MKSATKYTAKQLIGQLIKQQRLKQQITQQGLADLLNVDRQYVWKLEKGKINLTMDYLDKIISKLKCENNDFFKIDINAN